MGSLITIVNLKDAYVQENGIIRLEDGRYIGRLDGITFDEIQRYEYVKEHGEDSI